MIVYNTNTNVPIWERLNANQFQEKDNIYRWKVDGKRIIFKQLSNEERAVNADGPCTRLAVVIP